MARNILLISLIVLCISCNKDDNNKSNKVYEYIEIPYWSDKYLLGSNKSGGIDTIWTGLSSNRPSLVYNNVGYLFRVIKEGDLSKSTYRAHVFLMKDSSGVITGDDYIEVMPSSYTVNGVQQYQKQGIKANHAPFNVNVPGGVFMAKQ